MAGARVEHPPSCSQDTLPSGTVRAGGTTGCLALVWTSMSIWASSLPTFAIASQTLDFGGVVPPAMAQVSLAVGAPSAIATPGVPAVLE